MKDIVADKILSFLSTNNIEYSEVNNLIVIPIEHLNNTIDIFYINEMFYIDKNDYVGQPHIILHWNPKNKDGSSDINKYGLCLTMNGSDRRYNKLTAKGELDRAKEIIFELWEDPIGERFKEINTYFQTKNMIESYINIYGEVVDIKTKKKI